MTKLKTMIDLCKTCEAYPCGDIEAGNHCDGLNHEPEADTNKKLNEQIKKLFQEHANRCFHDEYDNRGLSEEFVNNYFSEDKPADYKEICYRLSQELKEANEQINFLYNRCEVLQTSVGELEAIEVMLKQTVDKMKNCENCKHNILEYEGYCCSLPFDYKNPDDACRRRHDNKKCKDLWELE